VQGRSGLVEVEYQRVAPPGCDEGMAITIDSEAVTDGTV
jgi:hypothetical protein